MNTAPARNFCISPVHLPASPSIPTLALFLVHALLEPLADRAVRVAHPRARVGVGRGLGRVVCREVLQEREAVHEGL